MWGLGQDAGIRKFLAKNDVMFLLSSVLAWSGH